MPEEKRVTITPEQRLAIEQAFIARFPIMPNKKFIKWIKPFLILLKLAFDDVTERGDVK